MLMDWVKCLMEMEIANLQRTEFKDTLKFIMKKKINYGWSIWPKFYCSNS